MALVDDAARMNSPSAQILMREEVRKYSLLPPPLHRQQLYRRYFALTARFAAIKSTNALAFISLDTAEKALESVKHFLNLPIDPEDWDVWSKEARRQAKITERITKRRHTTASVLWGL
jgi:hypothetical protein